MTHQKHDALRIAPHPRTLRKAREQIRWMVTDEVSLPKIRNYFARWLRWWVNTSETWDFEELAKRFISTCWQGTAAAIATDVLRHYTTGLDTRVWQGDSTRAA